MTELHARGAKNVLLTLGGAGAYFSNGERLWFARRAWEVKVRSTVCAGDSSLAACLSLWSSERDREEDALRRSMATGAHVVECAGLGDFARVGEYFTPAVRRTSCLLWVVQGRTSRTASACGSPGAPLR